MLILPPAQGRAAPGGRTLTRRERRLVRGVAAVAAALVIVVIVSFAVAGRSTGHGCVRATIPGPVGAEEVYRCAGAAHRLCGTLGTAGGYRGQAARAIAVECRKAGIPVGGRT